MGNCESLTVIASVELGFRLRARTFLKYKKRPVKVVSKMSSTDLASIFISRYCDNKKNKSRPNARIFRASAGHYTFPRRVMISALVLQVETICLGAFRMVILAVMYN